MKTLNLIGDINFLMTGLNYLQNKFSFTIHSSGTPVYVHHRPGPLEVIKNDQAYTLYYEETAHFFRAFTMILTHDSSEPFHLIEHPQFQEIGPMIDLSRNAVLHLAKFKEILLTCATLGLNTCMLYMEDTYTIPEYPYFGYMRGRYTQEELSSLDDFAYHLGIELIPAIQVLGHLKNPLKWNFAQDIKDTEDILLVDEPATYQFLSAAIAAASQPFRSQKIHIGMDEAHQLGLGNFLKKNGVENRFDIMNRHLHKVKQITDTLQLDVQMWSDMFFRLGSKTGDYYDLKADIPKETIENMPDVSLVYWDYYHHDQQAYHQLINIHRSLKKPVIFAGGIWLWNGIAPNYGKTIDATQKALAACKETGIQTVYATLWQDDGGETPFDTCLLGLQLFAEHQFYPEVSLAHLGKQLKQMQQEDIHSYLLLDLFDRTPGTDSINSHASHASKLALYQDPLLGLYDINLNRHPLKKHYQDLYQQLKQTPTTKKTELLFQFYQQLALVLSQKVDLGLQIRQAYQHKNTQEMEELLVLIKQLQEDTQELRSLHRELWLGQNKVFGWEILDIRYGGILARLDSAYLRLTAWVSHPQLVLEELEETLLPFDGPYVMPDEGIIGRNLYQGIISPSKLSDV